MPINSLARYVRSEQVSLSTDNNIISHFFKILGIYYTLFFRNIVLCQFPPLSHTKEKRENKKKKKEMRNERNNEKKNKKTERKKVPKKER